MMNTITRDITTRPTQGMFMRQLTITMSIIMKVTITKLIQATHTQLLIVTKNIILMQKPHTMVMYILMTAMLMRTKELMTMLMPMREVMQGRLSLLQSKQRLLVLCLR